MKALTFLSLVLIGGGVVAYGSIWVEFIAPTLTGAIDGQVGPLTLLVGNGISGVAILGGAWFLKAQ